MTVTGISGQGL